jgi:hypothetical protein
MYVCVCIYVYMYKGWAIKIQLLHRDFQWSIVLPLLINPLLIPHLEWSVGLCIWDSHSSHLVQWRPGPGDEILNKVWPHNHIGYVCLIHYLLGTFRKWDHQSISILNSRWQCPVSSPTTHLHWSLFSFNRSFVLLATQQSRCLQIRWYPCLNTIRWPTEVRYCVRVKY